MKFVKANAVLVICGAVVLLALIAIYWPLSFTKADVLKKASDRLDEAKSVSSLSVPINIPFGPAPFNAPPTDEMARAKTTVRDEMKKQAQKINDQAAKDNQRGRLVEGSKPPVPLLNGKPEPHFLPEREQAGDPMGFKEDYKRLFPVWIASLTGKSDVHPVPPTLPELTAAYETNVRGAGGAGPNDPNGAENRNTFFLSQVSLRANSIRMYVDDEALLQDHEWSDSPNPPSPEQIFQAIVEAWLQKDVISAINAVNGDSKDVGSSPIKRLQRIAIGGDAEMAGGFAGGGKGGLFLEPVNAVENAPPPANNGIDLTHTLTGHVGGASYDTVLVGITLYIDPAAENKFYEALYRQNNGYTVLNVRTTIVDPLDAAANGYLYGKTQVVKKEILVEALFFRSWLVPLMPPTVKNGTAPLGGHSSRPTPATPGGGAAPGGSLGNGVDNQL